MIQILRNWWTFRTIRATDVDVARAGDRHYLLAHTRRRFKPVTMLEMSRDELAGLGEEICDATTDEEATRE